MRQRAPRLLFRLEGVLTQTVESALFSALRGSDTPADPTARRSVRDLASAMRSGTLDWNRLCAQAALILGAGEEGSLLGMRVLESLRVTAGIEELLASVDSLLDSWLFSEIDRGVIAPALKRLGIDRRIPANRWLFSSDNRRLRVDAPRELIGAITRRLNAPRTALLWIDDRPSVTARVIRGGSNAVVFVDAFRLRRNLVLRGLLE